MLTSTPVRGRLAGCRVAARCQQGFSLVELLITMSLLLTVMVVISGTFISGTNAETNIEQRYQTQADARAALTRLRQDVHCAYDVQSMDYNAATKGFTLSLTEVFGTCAAVDSSGPSGSQVQLQWCTAPAVAGSTTLYNLYRGNTSCNTTSTPVVRNIVAPSGGWPSNSLATSATSWNGNIWPDVSTVSGVSAGSCTTDYLKTLPVDIAINDYSTSAPNATYELKDNIALRNSTRCNTTSGSGGSQSRPTLSLSVPPAMLINTTMAAGSIVATLTGSTTPSTQITFYRTTSPSASAPTTCTGSGWSVVGTASPSADGTFSPSAGFSPGATAGTYWWYLSMPSDTNNKAATTSCPSTVSTQVASSKSTPTITVGAPANVTTGVAVPAVSITATVSGSLYASGPVTIYAYFGASFPTSCPGGGWTTIGTLTPSGNGTYSPSGGLASPSAGTYWWYAAFAGDSTNNAANSLCNSGSMTKSTVAAGPTLSTLQEFDTDHDGLVDQVKATFGSTLGSCTAPCTTGWTLSGVPSGGSLASVTVSGSVATMTLNEGAGAQDTTAGAFSIAMTAPGSIVDSNGRYASFASTAVADKATPMATNITLANGAGTLGKADPGDQVTIAYSEAVKPSTICSAWSTSNVNQSASGVTITINKSTQVLTVSSAGTCTSFTGGSVTLPASYATGGSNTTFTSSTLAYDATAHTLTITFGVVGGGTQATGVAAGTPTYSAGTTIQDLAANAITTGPYSGTSSRF